MFPRRGRINPRMAQVARFQESIQFYLRNSLDIITILNPKKDPNFRDLVKLGRYQVHQASRHQNLDQIYHSINGHLINQHEYFFMKTLYNKGQFINKPGLPSKSIFNFIYSKHTLFDKIKYILAIGMHIPLLRNRQE